MSAAPMHPRRIVYFGTPEMAVLPLEALVNAGFEVVAVVTRIDKRRGRGGDMLPSPVKRAAEALGLPVLHTVDDALQVGADLGVVVAFGQIVKPHALAVLPMVNLHFSLLPRWRGAAPVERAILAGDEVTGVCLMQVAEGLDTGDVHGCVEVAIGTDETAASLRARLVAAGSAMLVEQLTAGLGEARPQDGEATYAAKLHSDDLLLDWSQPAILRHRVVRLGGAHTTFRGRRLKVLAADLIDPSAVGDTLDGDIVGGIRLTTVQPESKGPMPFAAFANGARPAPGERLGT